MNLLERPCDALARAQVCGHHVESGRQCGVGRPAPKIAGHADHVPAVPRQALGERTPDSASHPRDYRGGLCDARADDHTRTIRRTRMTGSLVMA
jgi:hypothetical protein